MNCKCIILLIIILLILKKNYTNVIENILIYDTPDANPDQLNNISSESNSDNQLYTDISTLLNQSLSSEKMYSDQLNDINNKSDMIGGSLDSINFDNITNNYNPPLYRKNRKKTSGKSRRKSGKSRRTSGKSRRTSGKETSNPRIKPRKGTSHTKLPPLLHSVDVSSGISGCRQFATVI